MKTRTGWRLLVLVCGLLVSSSASGADRKLRILCFGAHPDDAELSAGGCAALWTAGGHAVKFVSATNGDIGHWREAGGPLALRRTAEVEAVARILGNEVQVLDIHDGEILPTLENRRTVTRLIREWRADIVMTHRPNDYHPDHRYLGQLVQDAAYMVSVPFFCPDSPALPWNPVFLYYSDDFQKPDPFRPDIVVPTDAVLEKKLAAVAAMPSQFYEGGALGSADLVPSDPAGIAKRKAEVRAGWEARFSAEADKYREALASWVGADRAKAVRSVEAFEICEYGRIPTRAELKDLFPFLWP